MCVLSSNLPVAAPVGHHQGSADEARNESSGHDTVWLQFFVAVPEEFMSTHTHTHTHEQLHMIMLKVPNPVCVCVSYLRSIVTKWNMGTSPRLHGKSHNLSFDKDKQQNKHLKKN